MNRPSEWKILMDSDVCATTKLRLDKRKELRRTHTYPICVFVYYRLEQKPYRVGLSCTPDEWEKMNGRHLRDDSLKQILSKASAELRKAEEIARALGENFTFDKFERLFRGTNSIAVRNKQDVYEAMEAHIATLTEEERFTTAAPFINAVKSLRIFEPTLKYRQVTVSFLSRYESYMLNKGYEISTIGFYLRSLRRIMMLALEAQIITQEMYPFGPKKKGKYQIPVKRKKKEPIPVECLGKLLQYEPQTEAEAKALALWRFSLYSNGMNMADVFNLKKKNFGVEVFEFNRKKTLRLCVNNVTVQVYQTEQIMEIVSQWRTPGNDPDDYMFDICKKGMGENEKARVRANYIRVIDNYLRGIRRRLKIPYRITACTARDLWATLMAKNNVSIHYISQGLGHTSLTTTQNYLAAFDLEEKKEAAFKLLEIINVKPESNGKGTAESA